MRTEFSAVLISPWLCPFCRQGTLTTVKVPTFRYQKDTHIDERHRHRYEVNPELIDKFEEQGMQFVGKDETGRRMEILELSGHPYFVATQFHPEYKSRPGKPSPVFLGAYQNDLTPNVLTKHGS